MGLSDSGSFYSPLCTVWLGWSRNSGDPFHLRERVLNWNQSRLLSRRGEVRTAFPANTPYSPCRATPSTDVPMTAFIQHESLHYLLSTSLSPPRCRRSTKDLEFSSQHHRDSPRLGIACPCWLESTEHQCHSRYL